MYVKTTEGKVTRDQERSSGTGGHGNEGCVSVHVGVYKQDTSTDCLGPWEALKHS